MSVTAERHLSALLEIDALTARVIALEGTLRTVQDLLLTLPGGVDLDADPDNDSPSDMMAHVAGLCVQEIDRVLMEDEQ